jgi:hypothetical protein
MSKILVTATWDDVPHLSEETKAELLKEIPPYQRDARTRGVAQLGSGGIYQMPETELAVSDFEIPGHWPRAYGMDVGWNKTAAVWGARDNQTGVIYLYSEHYRGQTEPIIHAEAIKARGQWIPGVIDPAATGSSQIDGRRLIDIYRSYGLNLEEAINAVEAGIVATWIAMSQGKLKVFKSLSNWWSEFRTYQRDEQGRIVNPHTYHLMDCTRYFMMSGIDKMKMKPAQEQGKAKYVMEDSKSQGWMG